MRARRERRSGAWRAMRATLVRYRGTVQAAIDVLAWMAALPAAMVLRFDFSLPAGWGSFDWPQLAGAMVVAATLQVVVGIAGGLYRGRWRYGSFDEVAHLVGSVFVTIVGFNLINRWVAVGSEQLVPHSVTVVGGMLALFAMAGSRYVFRLSLDRRLRPDGTTATKVLVFGAGEGGIQLLSTMLRNPASPYLPVGLLDDNPMKRNLEIMGIPMLGDRRDMARAADRTGATTLVIAIPRAGSDLVREVSQLALDAGLDVWTLPALSEMLGDRVGLADVRPLTVEDLLGRHEIQTDLVVISRYLTGRRVLITGAGGSIGNELCYQISRLAPSALTMVDRDESALHGLQLRLEGRATLDDRSLVVCDIRDRERLAAVFAEHRPDVVFHAAALKHLPLLEMHPEEAVKTNVVATSHLLDLAVEHGVDRFVNISTDKAADPTSVLGYSKRLAERLTAGAAATASGTFLSVRFGNVLGSRGSVLTTFRAQVEAGGPLTVTDPDVTRYFMTVEEAVQLVVQAGAVGRQGEALVLDMGAPVRIDDVARRFATQSDRPIDIVYTGLRPGEKRHEVLFGVGEVDVRPAHPLISHVSVPPISAADLATLQSPGIGREAIIAELRHLSVPEPGGPVVAAPA